VHQLSNIFLMGRWPIDMMPGVMRLASVLLLTLANQDIFSATIPNKLQAYLAVGRPILAAINGEGANVISDSKAGFVVPAESIGDLTSKALLMAGMTKAELELMGSNGISYFLDNFKHDNLMFKLVDHFHSLFCEES
jgi:glycosyltransferase involved in cell wall biosynthesis